MDKVTFVPAVGFYAYCDIQAPEIRSTKSETSSNVQNNKPKQKHRPVFGFLNILILNLFRA
jgi:hypothetical protein